MQYRNFKSLTKEEIEYIVRKIFKVEKVKEIDYCIDQEFIEVTITSKWIMDNEEIEIDDIVTLFPDGDIEVDFSIFKEDRDLFKQYLLSKGINDLLKDNPFIKKPTTFESLGYEKTLEDDEFIEFVSNKERAMIMIYLENKKFVKLNLFYDRAMLLKKEELEAIYYFYKELGWIE